MIFVITGTEAFSFDRLIIEIDRLLEQNIIKEEVFIQLGSCEYTPKLCKFEKWLSFDKMCEKIEKSNLVIAHAGAGTTLLCLELGKRPIVVTRKKYFNEHLDDHQVSFAKVMEGLDVIDVAYNVGDIEDLVKKQMNNHGTKNEFKKNNNDIIKYLDLWYKSE